MAEKKELKIRALIPENEPALGKALEKRGLAVKPYSSLKTLHQQNEAIAGLAPEERVLLFYAITHASSPTPIPSATAALAEPTQHPSALLSIPREQRRPLQEIMVAQILRMRLENALATHDRSRIGLVLMLPRESDLVNHIPRSAQALLQPVHENEINACVSDFENAIRDTRQQTSDALDPDFDIDFEEGCPLPAASPLELKPKNEVGIAPVDSISTPAEIPSAIVQVTQPETVLLYRSDYSEPDSRDVLNSKPPANQVVDATFMADGSFEMMQDDTSLNPLPAKTQLSLEDENHEALSPIHSEIPPKVAIADGASFRGRVEMKVVERQQALRLEDREQVIQILARYRMPLDLARHSQPKEGFDPQGRALFQNHEPNHEIISSSDWTTSRGLEKSAEVLGIRSLLALQDIAQNAARPHAGRKFEPVTLHLGPGDGKIMNEFALAESHRKNGNHKPTRHVGMARSLLFPLSNLLDRSMVDGLSDSTSQALTQFNQRITLLLQREFGRFGRMKINLSLPEDQIRLKDYLIRLANHPESLGYAQGVRETLSTTGKYADDKPDFLSDEEIHCFAEYTTDPTAFFGKYYGSFFNPESQQDMNALLDLGKNDILFGDFKDMPKLLENAGAFVTFAYSVKGFSHLEDYDYGVAFNEVAARLVPGGILIDDGVVESYTWHQRIQPLRDVQRNLGNDYRFYLIGNEEKPISVIVQRGIPGHKGDHCDFSLPEITKNCVGSKVVSLKNYETVWPEAALRNRITEHIKGQLLQGLVRGIADNSLRLECAQTWRQTCLKEIDPLFTGIFDRTVAEWKAKRGSRGGHIQKKDRQKLSGDRHFNSIFSRFASERGENLEHFIQDLLFRLYRERREGHRGGKEARKEGASD